MKIVKIKGFKNQIPFSALKSLLGKDRTFSLQQEKWHKNIEDSNIEISNELYKLIATENKRHLIYNNNLIVNTICNW